MKSTVTKEIKDELEAIRVANGGLLRPKDVCVRAFDDESHLHGWFEAQGAFDPAKAVEEYQLTLARRLIVRVNVVIPETLNKSVLVRAYTSLDSERQSGGGYRATLEVLSDDDLRAMMLDTAMRELAAFQRKYARLDALTPLFASIETIAGQRDITKPQAASA